MRTRHTSLFALESDEVMDSNVDAEAVAEVKSEVEEAHTDAVDAVAEIEDLQAQVIKGEAAAETLDELGEVIKAKVADGEGVSPDAAEVVEIAIESIRNNTGMPRSMGRIPAMESFKSRHSRVEASRIALESIGETLKKVWAKIVEVAKMIWEKIKSFFGNLFASYASLDKRLDTLKNKAGNIAEGATKTAEKLDNKTLAKFFTTAKKTSDADAVITAVSSLIAKSTTALAGTDPKSLEAAKTKEAVSALAKAEGDKIKAALNTAFGTVDNKSGENAIAYGPFPGAKVLVVNTDPETNVFSLGFDDFKEPAEEIAALADKAAILGIIGKLSVEAKRGETLKKALGVTEKILKANIDFATKMMKISSDSMDSKTDEEKAVKAAISASSKLVNANVRSVSSVLTKTPAMHFSTVKHGADLVEASISNFKKPEKKADESK